MARCRHRASSGERRRAGGDLRHFSPTLTCCRRRCCSRARPASARPPWWRWGVSGSGTPGVSTLTCSPAAAEAEFGTPRLRISPKARSPRPSKRRHHRSAVLFGSRCCSTMPTRLNRTDARSRWPCWERCVRSRRDRPCSSRSTTRSGSTHLPPQRSPSWCDACTANRSRFSSRALALRDRIVVPADRLRSVDVGPLTLGALRRLVEDKLDRVYPRALLRRVQDASGGNPFYALELARAPVRAGSFGPGEPLPVPARLGDLVEGWLRALPPETIEVLAAAAALADPTLELLKLQPATIRPCGYPRRSRPVSSSSSAAACASRIRSSPKPCVECSSRALHGDPPPPGGGRSRRRAARAPFGRGGTQPRPGSRSDVGGARRLPHGRGGPRRRPPSC